MFINLFLFSHRCFYDYAKNKPLAGYRRDKVTSSSALAERPRDASCLSVVCFNTTIPRAQSFIVSYFGFRFTSVYNYILFCCFRRNTQAFCYKQDSLMCGAAAFVDRGRWTTRKCYKQCSTMEKLTIRDGPAVIDVKARYWSKIAIFA